MGRSLRILWVLCALIFTNSLFSQSRTISGTVLSDDDNTSLVGVTVTNQKTNAKTATNDAGFYSIKASTGDVLSFTFVGFERKQETVGATDMVSVKLTAGHGQLDDVVVTSYGVRRERKELPYSVTEVSGEDIAQTRRDNFLNSLAGRVPGATITSTSGLPGASATIILRGATSIGGNNQPLFVVDGVPYDNQTLN